MAQYEALKQRISKGQVLLPGSEGFEESLKRWSETCIKPAAVVVKPVDSTEVSEAVKFATASKIPLVVKGGGHSTSGTSASDGGLVIDLGLMKSVSVNPEAKTITFGGGCLWKDVDEEAWKHGLATVGGTVNDTGVGGLTLGGGFGWLTAERGLVCDNLVSAEIVLADGRIVQVSADENEDLFWGIRGAGQSFGVATSFTLQAFDQKDIYTGFVIYPVEALPKLVDFTNFMHEQQDPKSSLLWGPTFAPPNNAPAIMSIVFYNGTEEEGKAFYKPLLDIAIADMASVKPFVEANAQLGGPWGRPPRKLQGGASFAPPLKLDYVQEVFDKFFPFAEEHNLQEGSIVAFEILPNKKIREVDLEATAYAARADIYHISPLWQWTDPNTDDAVRAFNRALVSRLKEAGGASKGVAQYNNYSDEQLQPEKAFGPNVKRLQDLKTKYDPDNVFWKWHGFYPRV
ncbi:hypothetical protein BX600DRAFT_546804 [Xylariales sp. PMI_506]|nr:hypothetical protein BX600DRAFT_546804 [Xylariales sp. PMI_506]